MTTGAATNDLANSPAARTLRSILIGLLICVAPSYAIEIPFTAFRKFTGGMLFLTVVVGTVTSIHLLKLGRQRLAGWILAP